MVELRLWGSGKGSRGGSAILTLTKGKTKLFSADTLGSELYMPFLLISVLCSSSEAFANFIATIPML